MKFFQRKQNVVDPGLRINELLNLEKELKRSRDFKALIKVHDELIKLDNSLSNISKRIPQKAYCLARIGRKKEAEQTFFEIRKYSQHLDRNDLIQKSTILGLFFRNDVTQFDDFHYNTIKNHLKHPQGSLNIKSIIFDYQDIIGFTESFDVKTLEIRQSTFSSELIYCIFAMMRSGSDSNIYYNRATNDVLSKVNGYFTSVLSKDQAFENRKLSERIINGDSSDCAVEGVHFKIPRLKLSKFLSAFNDCVDNNFDIAPFIVSFNHEINNKFQHHFTQEPYSTDKVYFSEIVSDIFFKSLNQCSNNNNWDSTKVELITQNTIKLIVLDFLKAANEA